MNNSPLTLLPIVQNCLPSPRLFLKTFTINEPLLGKYRQPLPTGPIRRTVLNCRGIRAQANLVAI